MTTATVWYANRAHVATAAGRWQRQPHGHQPDSPVLTLHGIRAATGEWGRQ